MSDSDVSSSEESDSHINQSASGLKSGVKNINPNEYSSLSESENSFVMPSSKSQLNKNKFKLQNRKSSKI